MKTFENYGKFDDETSEKLGKALKTLKTAWTALKSLENLRKVVLTSEKHLETFAKR